MKESVIWGGSILQYSKVLLLFSNEGCGVQCLSMFFFLMHFTKEVKSDVGCICISGAAACAF